MKRGNGYGDGMFRPLLARLERKLKEDEESVARTRRGIAALRDVLGLSQGAGLRVASKLGRHRDKCPRCKKGFLRTHALQKYCRRCQPRAKAEKNALWHKLHRADAPTTAGTKAKAKGVRILVGDPLKPGPEASS